jgi:hypothetical protein
MSETALSPRRDGQICGLIGTGHSRSHFDMRGLSLLCAGAARGLSAGGHPRMQPAE